MAIGFAVKIGLGSFSGPLFAASDGPPRFSQVMHGFSAAGTSQADANSGFRGAAPLIRRDAGNRMSQRHQCAAAAGRQSSEADRKGGMTRFSTAGYPSGGLPPGLIEARVPLGLLSEA